MIYDILTIIALAIMVGLIVIGALGALGKLGRHQKKVPSYIALGWGLVGLLAIMRGWLMFKAL